MSPAAHSPSFPALPTSVKIGAMRCSVRPLRPDDGPGLIAFFESHTAETIHQRYGYQITQMSPERAARLVGVDQSRDVALGMFEAPRGAANLVAVGRYCLLPEGQSAEVAFVVREDCRGRGIATMLLRILAKIARQRGLTRLVAQVQQDNPVMLSIFRKHGSKFSKIAGDGTVEVTISLARWKNQGPKLV